MKKICDKNNVDNSARCRRPKDFILGGKPIPPCTHEGEHEENDECHRDDNVNLCGGHCVDAPRCEMEDYDDPEPCQYLKIKIGYPCGHWHSSGKCTAKAAKMDVLIKELEEVSGKIVKLEDKPVEENIWYMCDNHCFAKLTKDVEESIRIIKYHFVDNGQSCGMLCWRGHPYVHANSDWPEFEAKVRDWYKQEVGGQK